MKGDFTRSTFDPAKHYQGVLMQQGRVQLDADWNEQVAIHAHRDETATSDTIGLTGAPMHNGGFAISLTPDGSDLAISSGRIYVDGILCELNPGSVAVAEIVEESGNTMVTLETLFVDGRMLAEDEWVEILHDGDPIQAQIITIVDPTERKIKLGGSLEVESKPRIRRLTTYTTQHDLPGAQMPETGAYAVYLDVWARHVTAHEDPDLREIALGGPDTATRAQVIAQVKLAPLNNIAGPLTCGSIPDLHALLPQRNGRLRARARPAEAASEPCLAPAGAGYRRLENQLYRVEVHRRREDGSITFKWSRDNGSVVTDWMGKNGADLQVSSLGRDNVLGFRSTTWAELIDDTYDLRGDSGTLVQVTPSPTADNTLTINQVESGGTTDYADFPRHPKLRRWDSTGEVKIEIAPDNNGYLHLEDGVEVRFEMDGDYQPGDYWLIPARTAIGDEGGDILWPRDLTDPNNPQPLALPPHGVEHHYCLLAVWQVGSPPQNCQPLFPPLTELTTLLYVGGDGQETMPGNVLLQKLQVRVVNGRAPVIDALVLFTDLVGDGSISPAGPVATVEPDGIAQCAWTLGASGAQKLTAKLLDAAGQPVPGQVVHFSANLSTASQVAYAPATCTNLAEAKTVQEAIDILCQVRQSGCCICVGKGGDYERLDEALNTLIEKGERDICICLLHGDHDVRQIEIERKAGEPDLHIMIAGCGAGSRVTLHGPIRFAGIDAVVLRDFAIDVAFVVEGSAALALDHCARIDLRGCHLAGFTKGGTLLFITKADRVRLAANLFEALTLESLEPTRQVFTAAIQEFSGNGLAMLFGLPHQGRFRLAEFRQVAQNVARWVAGLDVATRKNAQAALRRVVTTPEQRAIQSPGEVFNYTKFVQALGAEAMNPATLFELLLDIRRTALKTRPGTAIIIEQPRRVDETVLPALIPMADVLDQDDICLLENNDIAGILSLYGLPAEIAFIDEYLNSDILKQLAARLKENQIRFTNSFFGTLQLHDNQLVRVVVARTIVEELRKATEAQQSVTFAFDMFGRCQWSDNVFEGGRNFLLCRHLTLQANEFTQFAQPQGTSAVVGTFVADSTIYLANHGNNNMALRNLSRLIEQAINQEITITNL